MTQQGASEITIIDEQKKKKSKVKLIVIITIVSILIVGFIVCGPILMQTFQVVEGAKHPNAGLCWLGGIMIAIPMVALAVMCVTLVIKSFFKKKDDKK